MGAALPEQHDEWVVSPRYMTMEAPEAPRLPLTPFPSPAMRRSSDEEETSVHHFMGASPRRRLHRTRDGMLHRTYLVCWAALLGSAVPSLASAFYGESGRLERLDDSTFFISLEDDGGDAGLPEAWRAGFYARLDDVLVGQVSAIEVDRLVWPYPVVPLFSYDQRHWQPFADDEISRPTTDTLSLRHTFDRPQVWVAQREPFTSVELGRWLGRLDTTASGLPGVRCEVRLLGHTPGGQPLKLISVGDARGSAPARAVWVHARVHPGEPQASFMAAGMLDFLISNQPAAEAARERFTFHVVPMFNADGVALGHYRTNASLQNLESMWDLPSPPTEVALLRGAICALQAEGEEFVAALNLHSSHAPAAQAPFTFPHFGPASLGYAPEEARLWEQQMHFARAVAEAAAPLPFAATWEDAQPRPAPAGRGFLEVAMPERWWWRGWGPDVLAVTVEAVDGQVGAGGRWARGEDAAAIGAALVRGLAEALPQGR